MIKNRTTVPFLHFLLKAICFKGEKMKKILATFFVIAFFILSVVYLGVAEQKDAVVNQQRNVPIMSSKPFIPSEMDILRSEVTLLRQDIERERAEREKLRTEFDKQMTDVNKHTHRYKSPYGDQWYLTKTDPPIWAE